ncbi:hypothetical protein I6A84_03685 [Frankia sp. CNm7]|uniref:Uncharacterized protein n=1 Tax=Frankia nepalensis TaxID=1836974 RepID=A0A937RQY0_9ACTN|nr:hypothetical protein [Frankia nepalensis]MBL7494788.1 hypothetical protein [Frankia nepalensis]MBL7514338.1 hypothetical protein [Frankia nepalensis]MBL7517245.1 hypothetical protein [Frankia nepalensis]MBL7631734.1 hypothetical protein [Frankia nepalensis]
MVNDRPTADPAENLTENPTGESATGTPTTGTSATETTRPVSGARVAPRRRLDLDWEGGPAHGVDPEDSLRAGGHDDLARLLSDVPPHHVDR